MVETNSRRISKPQDEMIKAKFAHIEESVKILRCSSLNALQVAESPYRVSKGPVE